MKLSFLHEEAAFDVHHKRYNWLEAQENLATLLVIFTLRLFLFFYLLWLIHQQEREVFFMFKKWLKKLICIALAGITTLGTSLTALASENTPVDPSNVYATTIDELADMSRETIDALSTEEIDGYFEGAFSVDADDYSYEQKLSAVEAVSLVGQFQEATNQSNSMVRATSATTEALSSYTGKKGVAWVRDTNSSPLTLAEAVSGVYTLEVDYVTYYQAVTIYALGSDFDFFNSVKNAATTAIAASLICSKLNLPANAVIPATAISFGVSLGWDVLSTLDRTAMSNVIQDMEYTSLVRVDFITANNYVTIGYECFDLPSSDVTWESSSDCFKYNNIPNPTGKYGNWHTDEIGYLYSFG